MLDGGALGPGGCGGWKLSRRWSVDMSHQRRRCKPRGDGVWRPLTSKIEWSAVHGRRPARQPPQAPTCHAGHLPPRVQNAHSRCDPRGRGPGLCSSRRGLP
ncbi:unnamed protein product [Gadus morhua 'NCC']